MILRAIHFLLVAAYLVLPALAVSLAIRRHRRGDKRALPRLTVSFIAALALSVTLNLIYATGTGGKPVMSQVLIAGYFAAGLLLLLRGFDFALKALIAYGLRLRGEGKGFWRGTRVFAAAVLRVVVLFAVGLPYVMACVMTYRPKVLPLDDPRTQLGFQFERVEFRATDGTKLVGWWIPAQQPTQRRRAQAGNSAGAVEPDWGKRTVLVCHGLGAGKSNQLILARRLVPGGFNVLAFDFRAHGESGGQLAGFGALEQRDVLGAVRWVRANRAAQAEALYGVGASMGAAALISAAATDSDEGRAIAAIAAYATYDDLVALTGDLTRRFFAPPLDWTLHHLGLPMAAAQSGANLTRYVPARDADRLWPRPILLIHGMRDEIIDFERGRALLEAVPHPKYHLFFPEGTHNDIVDSEPAARIVLEFFRQAQAVPVI